MNKDFVPLNLIDAPCANWSGGRTWELALAPTGAAYKRRDFLWRASSALVEQEESLFTSLPDYERIILSLDGVLTLWHDEGDAIQLPPFTVHRFDGASRTRSRGRVRDFNLMLRKKSCNGDLSSFVLQPGESRQLFCQVNSRYLLFCVQGPAKLEQRSGSRDCSCVCAADDYLLFYGEPLLVGNYCTTSARFVLAEISDLTMEKDYSVSCGT